MLVTDLIRAVLLAFEISAALQVFSLFLILDMIFSCKLGFLLPQKMGTSREEAPAIMGFEFEGVEEGNSLAIGRGLWAGCNLISIF